ncbi:hypothetical protein RND71_043970 [Anisodus tanguticus]|uniref:SAM domain-containing protein n=1 Tax=Anisodus tanguticus TaxID=243964 RepID=A0AAE1UTN7_9SOLA|nr:hypothetical protein RND71_043970 [Anisodus tanguticus]
MKNFNKSNKTPNKSSNGNIQESQNKSKTNSFDWCTFLNKDVNFKAVPVSSFKHVPAANVWENLVENNLKIEIRNKDAFLPSDIKSINDVYWFATVIKVEGYYLLLRYEGYGDDCSSDFWINIYNPIIHPVGWSATQKKHLIPPKNIISKQADWKSYLTKNLVGAKTLPNNFAEQIKECLKSNFRVGMKLEVVDKTRISSVRLATINKIIGCRLHVVYDGLEDKDTGFWCNQQSPLIHPIGWAQLVGHELRATPEYAASSLEKAKTGCWGENDADFSYFPHLSKQMVEVNKDPNLRFNKGMKLEAIDPLNLSTICAATVTKVLRNNYVMVGIDGMMAPDGSDWFCYHASSGNIFPVGFSRLNGLNLTPPKDYNKPFNWFNYMKDKKAVAAPVSLFNNEIPNHGFKKGMYLEAVDLMEPRLICVAIIKEVVGRLLKIHFNGWDDSYDQWCDCESVELFPVGWCEIVGYPLEPPKEDSDSSTPGLMASNTFVFDNTIKKRGKHIYKGGRSKKRKRNTLSISDKDKLNGLSAKDEEDLLINYGNNDDQDNCTLFNSTIDSNEVTNDSNTFLENDKSLLEDKDNDLTSNSTVSIKPSPIILNNQNMQILDQHPILWTSNDVVNYFRSNDCGSYANAFLEHDISGKKLMRLTREDVWQLMENKLVWTREILEGCKFQGEESINVNVNCTNQYKPDLWDKEIVNRCIEEYNKGCQLAQINKFCESGAKNNLENNETICKIPNQPREFGIEYYKVCCEVCNKGKEAFSRKEICERILPTGSTIVDEITKKQFENCCNEHLERNLRKLEDFDDNLGEELTACSKMNCEHFCDDLDFEKGICRCRSNYRLNENGKTCDDIDECLYENMCNKYQKCVNLPGTYECKDLILNETISSNATTVSQKRSLLKNENEPENLEFTIDCKNGYYDPHINSCVGKTLN